MSEADDRGHEGLVSKLPDPLEPDVEATDVSVFPKVVHSRPFLTRDLSGRVLDLGAGDGDSLSYVGRLGSDDVTVHLLDPWELSFVAAAARDAVADADVDAHRERGCGEHLPYEADAFDAVVCREVLCAVDDPAAVLSEVHRVLRPDGEFRYFEHVRSTGLAGWVEDRVAPYWRRAISWCDVDRQTDETIADSDLTVVEQRRLRNVGTLPPWTYVAGVARPD